MKRFRMKRLGSGLFALVCLLTLAACGGRGDPNPPPPPPGNDISGTITAPQGGDVQGTVVEACFITGNQCDESSPNTQQLTITQTGASASYSFSGLAAGQYGVFAGKDVDGNNNFGDDGDFGGCYGGVGTCSAVTPPQTGLDVQLEVVGGATGSISGTLVYPGSANPGRTAGSGLESLSFPKDFVINTQKRNDLNADRPVEVVPGEVLVRFKGDASAQQLGRLRVGSTELSAVRTLALGPSQLQLYRAGGLSQAATLALVDSLRARPDVASAYPNWILHAFKTPNDEFYPLQWHYEAMNLPAAWDSEDGSSNPVTVAVVDTGAVDHPDLVDNLLPGYDFISDSDTAVDGDGRDDDPTDEGVGSDYHGSHVAGTIAATTNNGSGVAGVSWGAKVVPVRVLGDGGGTFADILDGVAWAAGGTVQGVPANPNPARVVNMSLGGDSGEPCPAEASQFFGSLAAQGVVVVVAAGNSDVDAATTFPASCDGVITVGATGPQNTRAPYSNYGSVVDVMATGGDTSQSFTVGGVTYPAGVLSTIEDGDSGDFVYAFYQGTSMASPHIAGIVALLLAKDPSLSFDQVLQRLQNAATPIGSCSEGCGAGLVDAAAALGGQGGGGPGPNPPPPPPTENVTTYVAAFYCKTSCSTVEDVDTERSTLVEVEVTSNTVPYTISDLEPGTYVAAAWQDLDKDNIVDNGEPFGVYFGPNDDPSLELAAGEDIKNIIIVLEPLVSSSTSGVSNSTEFGGGFDLRDELSAVVARPRVLEPFKLKLSR